MPNDHIPEPDPRRATFAAHLFFAVPFRIHELRRWGGPSELDWQRVRGAFDHDGGIPVHGGADLMFGGALLRSTMAETVHTVACLAFTPGGVRIAGLHFEVKADSPHLIMGEIDQRDQQDKRFARGLRE